MPRNREESASRGLESHYRRGVWQVREIHRPTPADGHLVTTPGAAPSAPPSFLDGVRALGVGVRFLRSRRDCWFAAAVPCLVVAAIAVPLSWLAIGRGGPWLADWLLPDTDTWYAVGAHALVRWLGSALGVYLVFWLALLLAPALSAPALEHLVRARELALGLPPRPSRGSWFELWCGLEAQFGALLLVLPLWSIYWLLAALVPAAGVLLLPLQAVPLALGLAWNLLDYPLTLRGIRARQRFALLRRRPAPVLGLGLAFAAVSWIPGAALILLPAGVVGATGLVWRILPGDAPLVHVNLP